MRKLLQRIALLAGLALLSACSSMPVAIVDREELCRSWRHQTVSKSDKLTEKTAAGIEGNNDARPAWGCAWGKNEAQP
jgi:hypothetical protein